MLEVEEFRQPPAFALGEDFHPFKVIVAANDRHDGDREKSDQGMTFALVFPRIGHGGKLLRNRTGHPGSFFSALHHRNLLKTSDFSTSLLRIVENAFALEKPAA